MLLDMFKYPRRRIFRQEQALKSGLLACCWIYLALMCHSAQAEITLITNKVEFNQLIEIGAILDFEGIAPDGGSKSFGGSEGLTLGGINFVGTGACGVSHLDVVSDSIDPSFDWGTGDSLLGDRFGYCQGAGIPIGNIQATLPENTYAVGSDFMLRFTDGSRPASPVMFTVHAGAHQQDFTLNSATNAAAFAGIISDTPIDSLQFRTLGVGGVASPYGALDNFIIGKAKSLAQITPRVAAGAGHSLALQSDGSLLSWGNNSDGQLGNGANDSILAPSPVDSSTDWLAIGVGGQHSLALKKDGSLWAWGKNDRGQLGDGTTKGRNQPGRIGADSDWIAIAAGGQANFALRQDQSLWAWGMNLRGTLGDGTTTDRTAPIQVGSSYRSVSADAHVLAIKMDGSLWAWGANEFGQVGDNSTTDRKVPVQIGVDTDWQAVAAGSRHSLALKKDGSLWAWGRNTWGQLGDGTTTDRKVPTRIGADNDWLMIQGGVEYSLATKQSGELWAWGYSSWGGLGNGSAAEQHTPVRIGMDGDWYAVDAANHSMGIKSDGSLWAWGWNFFGQLGTGDKNDRNTPVQILASGFKPPATDDLEKGLVAYYPFNGTANDDSGHDNHGLVLGATLTEDRYGSANSAYRFETGNYIDFGAGASLNITESLTTAAWVKTTQPFGHVLAKWGDNSLVTDQPQAYLMGVSEGRIVSAANAGPEDDNTYLSKTQVADGQWHFIAMVVDKALGKIMFYRDGAPDGVYPIVGQVITPKPETHLLMGVADRVNNINWYDGAIDDARVYNRALSESEIQKLYHVDDDQSPTILTASATELTYGESVTLTATVTGDKPTGSVSFYDGEALIATKTLFQGRATLQKVFAAGAHPLTVRYAGDAKNPPSQSPSVNLTVAQAAQAPLTLIVTPTQLISGGKATLKATGGTGTGAISYAATPEGSLTCTISANVLTARGGPGQCRVTATRAGNANYLSVSSNTIAVAVAFTPVSVGLTAVPTEPSYGQPLSFTATVSGNNPTGYVAFLEGTTQRAKMLLKSGQAVFTTSTLAAGAHKLVAKYLGDPNDAVTNSAPLPVTIAQAAQAPLTLTVTPTQLISGGKATLKATGGTGAGAIRYAATGTGGVACTIATTTLTVRGGPGQCLVTATKAGNANYLPVSSNTVGVEVAFTPVGVGLTATPANPVYGQPLSFTATVTGNNPTGYVAFLEGTTQRAKVLLNNGQAVFTTSTLAAGAHTLVAKYLGDANDAATNSAPLTVTIAQAEQRPLVLTATPDHLVIGDAGAQLAVSGGSGPGALTWAVTATGASVCKLTLAKVLKATGGAGTCEVTVTKAGSTNYLTATATLSVPVSGGNPALSWSLSHDLMLGLEGNPQGVWSFMETQEIHKPSGYVLFKTYSKPCMDDILGEYSTYRCWQNADAFYSSAQVGITSEKLSFESFIMPANTPFIHPGSDRSVLVRWTSPINGVIDILGRVSHINPLCGDGVNWFIDLGSENLLSGSLFKEEKTFSRNGVAVLEGTELFFIIDKNGDHGCDWTNMDVSIASQ